jgi:hypothetical protein
MIFRTLFAFTDLNCTEPLKPRAKLYVAVDKILPFCFHSSIFSPSLDITFEQGESLGMYILKSKVTDINSNVTTITEKTILFFKSQSSKNL